MRSLSFLLLLALCTRLAAGPLPLTSKDIALMLRSGYSSESILAELDRRRVLDAPDPATLKSLLEFGATAQLVTALERGVYAVPGAEAELARVRVADLAAKRQAQIEQDRKLSAAAPAQNATGRLPANPAPPGQALILDALKEKLVRCRDGSISRADGSELEKKKFVALYYSAHWCGPCRKFTPQLVEYYNRVAAAHPEFEIVFVSADRSRFNWETYIRESRMPWLAVDYDQIAGLEGVQQIGGGSIPSLLLLDSSSRMVASSYDGEKYLGPQNALIALDRIFAATAGN